MSIEHLSQNIQLAEILSQANNEMQWGNYADMERVDVFEVWTIREDNEVDQVAAYVKYEEALGAAAVHTLVIQAGDVPQIIRAVVVWYFRNSEEQSVLEVGIETRITDTERKKRLQLIDDSLEEVRLDLMARKIGGSGYD